MTGTALPKPAELFALSTDRIRRAACDLWPGQTLTLGDHVPSVTGYVHRATVGPAAAPLPGPQPRHLRERSPSTKTAEEITAAH